MKLENFSIISSSKQKSFEKKGINSTEQLLRILPKEYVDVTPGDHINGPKEYTTLKVVVEKVIQLNKLDGIKAVCSCVLPIVGKISVDVVWFRQPYLYEEIFLLKRKEVLLCGKITYNEAYKRYSCVQPLFFESCRSMGEQTLYCKYSFKGNSDDYMSNVIYNALNRSDLKEYVPEEILFEQGMYNIYTALMLSHFPPNRAEIDKAKERIVFDDCLYFALLSKIANEQILKSSNVIISNINKVNEAIEKLPFALTNDQKNAVWGILAQMKDQQLVRALVQGDVGCGKTIVAFLISIALAENGYQTAIMAPSKALAMQHYEDLKEVLDGLDIECGLLTSGMKKKELDALKEGISSGRIKIVVGTHSLLSDKIEFKNLACTIIDEEHKFGVIQRETITEKGKMGIHSISMSATPIPRTLALTMYDDSISLYNIKELPPGRLRTKNCVTDNQEAVYRFCLAQLKDKRQIFVVCPQIEEDDNIMSTTEVSEIYSKALSPYKVACLTGKTKAKEASDILQLFASGEIDVLVATSIIEVGINVPNATSIIIHNAERFGLASLHQLRGRVGRGKDQGYCVFFSEETQNQRLQAISSTTDGFEIALKDLEFRKTGDLIGTRQSGENRYVDLILAYPEIFNKAKSSAEKIYDKGLAPGVIKELEKFQ